MKLASICRTKEIRGYEFPGIIHNSSYFLTGLQVFADGLINCWEMVDLPMFINGSVLSIVSLGFLGNAQWSGHSTIVRVCFAMSTVNATQSYAWHSFEKKG